MSELYRERDFCFYRAFVGSTSWFIYCTEKSVFLAIGSSIETHVIDSNAGFANKRPGVYNNVRGYQKYVGGAGARELRRVIKERSETE